MTELIRNEELHIKSGENQNKRNRDREVFISVLKLIMAMVSLQLVTFFLSLMVG